MKKVCFITTVPITLDAFVSPFAKYLHAHSNWDITFICDDNNDFSHTLPSYIHYIPISMRRGISLGGIAAMLKMIKIFKQEKFDLVQYSTPNAALYASIASKIAGIRHRKYHLMGFRYLGMSGLSKHIFKSIERLTCWLSTDIECVSPSNLALGIAERLFHPHKGHVILHGSSAGVDTVRFNIDNKAEWRKKLRQQFGYSDSDCVFGFVGRITVDKGINELLSAFLALPDGPQKLFIIGPAENTDSLDSALLNAAHDNPKITWHPYAQNIEQFFSVMDVLVLPSYREGFGNVIIEAEAMGVPVIVTDIPGPTDAMVADKTGLIVRKADPEDLRRAMEFMQNNPALRLEMGRNAYHFAKDNFEQQQLFAEILKDRKALLGE